MCLDPELHKHVHGWAYSQASTLDGLLVCVGSGGTGLLMWVDAGGSVAGMARTLRSSGTSVEVPAETSGHRWAPAQ